MDMGLKRCGLPIPPVLPANLKQRVGYLPERAVFHRFHQLGKQVAVGHGHLLQLLEVRRGLVSVALVQQREHVDLILWAVRPDKGK